MRLGIPDDDFGYNQIIIYTVAGHSKEASTILNLKDMEAPEQAYETIVKMGTTLDENNVPRIGHLSFGCLGRKMMKTRRARKHLALRVIFYELILNKALTKILTGGG